MYKLCKKIIFIFIHFDLNSFNPIFILKLINISLRAIDFNFTLINCLIITMTTVINFNFNLYLTINHFDSLFENN